MKIDSINVIDTKTEYVEIKKNNPVKYVTKTYLINGDITVSIKFLYGGTDEMFNEELLDLLDSKKEAKAFLKVDEKRKLEDRIYKLEELLDKYNIDY